jgi:sugar phosphate isomerase/epimerase
MGVRSGNPETVPYQWGDASMNLRATCGSLAGAIRGLIMCVLTVQIACAAPAGHVEPSAPGMLWEHDNLVAWSVVPFDARQREPEERAQMLERLGLRNFAYSWRAQHVPTFDAEIDALKGHGINLLAWALYGSQNPNTEAILETFKRHNVHPQLWVMEFPTNERADFPKTPAEQERRVTEEADRIGSLVKLAAPYGVKIDLYNHNGWFGMVDNQVAIIEALRKVGITDVGIVYNFSHARDDLHDDTVNFPALWKKMKPYAVAVNITGTHSEGTIVYPSQGDRELEMMRTIQDSGWRGPVGIIAEKGGDAEVTLKNCITGIDWLSAELKQPGSGGPRPFPPSS